MPASMLYIEDTAFEDCYDVTIKVPYNSVLDEYYNSHSFGNNSKIIRYDAPYYEKSELDKEKLERFLFEMKYKKEHNDYEFRKEMGLLTKEEYERENTWYLDMLSNRDDWDDL